MHNPLGFSCAQTLNLSTPISSKISWIASPCEKLSAQNRADCQFISSFVHSHSSIRWDQFFISFSISVGRRCPMPTWTLCILYPYSASLHPLVHSSLGETIVAIMKEHSAMNCCSLHPRWPQKSDNSAQFSLGPLHQRSRQVGNSLSRLMRMMRWCGRFQQACQKWG